MKRASSTYVLGGGKLHECASQGGTKDALHIAPLDRSHFALILATHVLGLSEPALGELQPGSKELNACPWLAGRTESLVCHKICAVCFSSLSKLILGSPWTLAEPQRARTAALCSASRGSEPMAILLLVCLHMAAH